MFQPIYEKGTIKVVWIKDDSGRIFSKMFNEVEKAKKFAPELIVMLTSTASVESDGKLAKQLKKETGARTVAVGVHATAVPEDTLKKGFDIIAKGE